MSRVPPPFPGRRGSPPPLAHLHQGHQEAAQGVDVVAFLVGRQLRVSAGHCERAGLQGRAGPSPAPPRRTHPALLYNIRCPFKNSLTAVLKPRPQQAPPLPKAGPHCRHCYNPQAQSPAPFPKPLPQCPAPSHRCRSPAHFPEAPPPCPKTPPTAQPQPDFEAPPQPTAAPPTLL